ncbi:MAG: hypothetical protein EAZ95_16105 [Bacteroidetes bacterium]|nr:MAG: hypothetical protein EAZ95_16105 [Bacteroidota bacterium]
MFTKKLLFTLFVFCFWQHTEAQTTLKLRNEAQTPYPIAGKLVSSIKVPSKEVIQVYAEFVGKDKTFKITTVEYDNEGLLSNISLKTIPVAEMNFQTDGYGSRVEEEENDYFGKGKIAKVTLLCNTQNSCFTEEKIDVWAEAGTETTKDKTSFAMIFFSKKADAEAFLKDITSKK